MMRANCALVLLAATAAQADDGGTLDIEVRNRAVVAGAIGAPGKLDTLRIRMPEGAELTVALHGVGKLSPELRILGPDEVPIDLTPFAVRDKKGVTISGLEPGPPGLYRIDVRARDGAVGKYLLTAEWRLDAVETFSGATGADGATYVFEAEAGTKIAVDMRTVDPDASVRAVKLAGPHGFEVTFSDPPRPSAVQRASTRALPSTGRYELSIATDEPGREISGTLQRKPPTRKARVNLRGAEKKGKGVARTVSRLFTRDGGSFAVPQLEEAQRVSLDASGVSLSVPSGGVTVPTSFLLRTDDDAIDDPLGFAPAGVSIRFDAGGAAFGESVAVTLPYDVGAFTPGDVLSDICILRRDDAGGVFEVDRGSATVDVAGGFVTFPTSHFSSFQVFSPPVELVEVARAGAPNDLAVDPDGPFVYLTSDVLTAELPAAAVMVYTPGGALELLAGGGEFVGDGVDRLDYDFDGDMGGDGAVVSALAVDAAHNVLVVTSDIARTKSIVYVILTSGIVVRVAGDGTSVVDEDEPARRTGLPFCCGADFDSVGNVVVVTDSFLYPASDLVYAIVAEPGGGLDDISIHAIAGGGEVDVSGAPPRETRLFDPLAVLVDSQDRVIVGDRDWIVRFDLAAGTTTTLAGTNFGESEAVTGRTIGGVGAPLRTVVLGAIDDLAFAPGREDILYAADPESGIVWRLDLERDRAFIAAGRRVTFGETLITRDPDPGAADPDAELNFPVAVAPLGDEVFIAERFDDRLFSLRRRTR